MKYYCIDCGTLLKEIGMGGLECDNCKAQYFPYTNNGGYTQLEKVKGR